ncbi:pseudouridine synthase [Azoarcus olearius]|uniref:Dual-specificity RNA pseudouridine synthase RluF n=1 Tax=Azoarcus sp. (strain BH72) TaxID=418699 RepID=A1K3P0_AZOSB|nr:pseudouridine synthase [Azoarcus olearius]CAL93445.1 pseudouridylate synthase [Azoarcus olearius]
MSTIRKNPPQPAPSRIAGTLKLRKPAADDNGESAAGADPAQSVAAGSDKRARPSSAGEEGRAPRSGARGGQASRGERPRQDAEPRRQPRARPAQEGEAPRRSRRDPGDGGTERHPRRDAGASEERPRRREAADERQARPGYGRRDDGPARAGARPAREQGRERGEASGRRHGGEGGERASAPRAAYDERRRAGGDERAPRRAAGDAARTSPRPAGPRPAAAAPRPASAERAPRRREEAPARAPAAPRAPAVQSGDGEAPSGVRLSKVMADRGICSRREADELIERGWVFVDGRRVSELGTRIDPDARVVLAPEAKKAQAQRVTILLHKPVGYVSGQPEPGYEPAVTLIGGDNQFDRDVAQRFHPSQLKGLAPAGRLDIDSTGLLVLTQDGRIARQLIGDDSKVEKEYLVRVEGELVDDGLALLNHGLSLDDKPLRPAKVEWINEDQLRFVLKEGRKRQIRRMCELVGLRVVGLKRVRIGRVKLGDLPLGEWRYLRDDEVF